MLSVLFTQGVRYLFYALVVVLALWVGARFLATVLGPYLGAFLFIGYFVGFLATLVWRLDQLNRLAPRGPDVVEATFELRRPGRRTWRAELRFDPDRLSAVLHAASFALIWPLYRLTSLSSWIRRRSADGALEDVTALLAGLATVVVLYRLERVETFPMAALFLPSLCFFSSILLRYAAYLAEPNGAAGVLVRRAPNAGRGRRLVWLLTLTLLDAAALGLSLHLIGVSQDWFLGPKAPPPLGFAWDVTWAAPRTLLQPVLGLPPEPYAAGAAVVGVFWLLAVVSNLWRCAVRRPLPSATEALQGAEVPAAALEDKSGARAGGSRSG